MKPFLPLVATLCLLGCATTGGMRSASLDKGVPRTYAANFDQVLEVAKKACYASGLHIEETNNVDDRTCIIIAKKGATMWSRGEVVRVVVEKTGDSETTVRVWSKRKLATNITAKGDYSEDIFRNIDSRLK